MRSCHADSHYTKIVVFPTGIGYGAHSHLPDHPLGLGNNKRITIKLWSGGK